LKKKAGWKGSKRENILSCPEGREGWAEHPFIPYQNGNNYYVSYRTALHIMASRSKLPFMFLPQQQRKGPLEFQGYLYKFIRISKRKFFGFGKNKISDARLTLQTGKKQ